MGGIVHYVLALLSLFTAICVERIISITYHHHNLTILSLFVWNLNWSFVFENKISFFCIKIIIIVFYISIYMLKLLYAIKQKSVKLRIFNKIIKFNKKKQRSLAYYMSPALYFIISGNRHTWLDPAMATRIGTGMPIRVGIWTCNGNQIRATVLNSQIAMTNNLRWNITAKRFLLDPPKKKSWPFWNQWP